MKCAVMQPMYLPWAGYFNLISSVDRFYYLDDAQYERGTWQNRNRILLNGQAQFLTVPAGGLYDERPAPKAPQADSQSV